MEYFIRRRLITCAFIFICLINAHGIILQAKIEKLVTAMGGVLHARVSSDVSFVIVKNVLAAKYKASFLNFSF